MNISELFRASQIGTLTGPGKAGDVRPAGKPGATPPGPSEFHDILKQQDQQINFSQHAETRIKSRAIPWDAELERRVTGGIDAAQAKGSREALILADNVAVIANVKSRTVITAMDRTQLKEKIFTNIDSAVLV